MIHEEEEKGWSFKTRDCNQTTKENVETCEYMAKQQSEVIVFWKNNPFNFCNFFFQQTYIAFRFSPNIFAVYASFTLAY